MFVLDPSSVMRDLMLINSLVIKWWWTLMGIVPDILSIVNYQEKIDSPRIVVKFCFGTWHSTFSQEANQTDVRFNK